jgi:hypothetical protein
VRFYKAHKGSPGGFKRWETKSAAQALKWGYVPSVTTILSVIRAGYVDEYLIRQCLEHYEAFHDFKAAVSYRDDKAADFGTVCHALVEARLSGKECAVEHDHRHQQTCEPLWCWIDENIEQVLFTECQFADNALGYGGTSDLLALMKDGRQMLLDLKTKRNSPKFPLGPDMGCKYQLSAYRKHFQKLYGPMGIGNLFLASPFGYLPQPRLAVFDYGDSDWMDGFEAAHKLWREQHGVCAAAQTTCGVETKETA